MRWQMRFLEPNLLLCVSDDAELPADSLEERLVQFAIAVVSLVGQLPQNFQAKHIATQLLRSGRLTHLTSALITNH